MWSNHCRLEQRRQWWDLRQVWIAFLHKFWLYEQFSQKRACPFGLFLNSMCAWELYMVKKKSKTRNQPEQTLCFLGCADFLVPVAKNVYRMYTGYVQDIFLVFLKWICTQLRVWICARCTQLRVWICARCTQLRAFPKMCTRCTQLRVCPFLVFFWIQCAQMAACIAQLVRAFG